MIIYRLYQSATSSSQWQEAYYQKLEVYLLRLRDILLIYLNYRAGLAPVGQLKLYFNSIVLKLMLLSYSMVHYNSRLITLSLFSENNYEIVIVCMCQSNHLQIKYFYHRIVNLIIYSRFRILEYLTARIDPQQQNPQFLQCINNHPHYQDQCDTYSNYNSNIQLHFRHKLNIWQSKLSIRY